MIKYLLIFILFIPLVAIAGGNVRYFPKGTFATEDDETNKITIKSINGSVSTYSSTDDLMNDYYSELFINIDEPSLWERSQANKESETYRLFIEPAFSNMICVRIDIDNSEIDSSENVAIYKKVITHDKSDEEGEIIKGRLIINKNKSLSIDDIKPLIKQLDDIKLFNMNSKDFPLTNIKTGTISTDVTTYFFEHVKNNKYQTLKIPVPNYGPIDNEMFYQLAQYFINLAE